jgi:hypothetical protein
MLMSVALFQCNQNSVSTTNKLHPNDPFKNTIVQSQAFEINSKQDNIVEGENGTIVVCPKGCFLNSKGEIVTDQVNIELAEALTLNDMLLSNLTTTSDGKLLETDGMIYFNATANGLQLTINKDNPIYIEIPTAEKKAGMMAYKGVRDEKGNMNWIDPKKIDNFLLTVDLSLLDFLPEGFQNEVNLGMPFKKHETATPEITDSLYYSLSESDGRNLTNDLPETVYNEPFYNENSQVVDGKYSSESYQVNSVEVVADSAVIRSVESCGIDPAIIKVIKSAKYQNTFIATREFEARLRIIFKTCRNDILETYINNIDKNLFEADSLAAVAVGEGTYLQNFIDFSQQRLTKVEDANKYAELLKGYYEKQLSKVKSELDSEQKKLMKELDKKNEAAQEVADKYTKLLWKREKYRMETYGFNWSETGWINVDRGVTPKEWFAQPLEITVTNGKQFDRVYTYVV